MTARPSRRTWTTLDDDRLLAQCEVDTYRASGPGGQKRNKTSSAVRLRHLPSGLLVIAEESRSQHENKAKALVRLRRELHLKWRDPGSVDAPEIAEARDKEGKLKLSPRDPRFWPAASAVLDLLVDHQGRVAETAEKLQLSTAQLVDFLVDEEHLRRETNRLRAELGLKPLKVN